MRRLIGIVLLCLCVGVRAQSPHGNIHVAILGDSNTWIGGDDCSKARGWNKWFKEAFRPASCVSYARSGATWTNTEATVVNMTENTGVLSDNNVIYNQILRLQNACKKGIQPNPNLILVAAGTNDVWFPDKRPQAMSKTADEAFTYSDGFITQRPAREVLTLAESVRYGCEMLMESFPDAQIVLLTPLQTVAVDNATIHQAGDLIEQCGHRMGLHVIRQDLVGSVYSVRERVQRYATYDGTHTSETGARRNGRMIARMVGEFLSF